MLFKVVVHLQTPQHANEYALHLDKSSVLTIEIVGEYVTLIVNNDLDVITKNFTLQRTLGIIERFDATLVKERPLLATMPKAERNKIMNEIVKELGGRSNALAGDIVMLGRKRNVRITLEDMDAYWELKDREEES